MSRSRKRRTPRAAALVKQAVAVGAFDAVFSRVAAHGQNGAFQEEAMMTLAVLCHSGEAVPGDEGPWTAVQEAIRMHTGRGEVMTEACILLAVLASQDEPATADIAALFCGELMTILSRAHAHAPTAVSVRTRTMWARRPAAGPPLAGKGERGYARAATVSRARGWGRPGRVYGVGIKC